MGSIKHSVFWDLHWVLVRYIMVTEAKAFQIREVLKMALSKEAMEYKKELEQNKEAIRELLLDRLKESERGQSVSFEEVELEMKERYGI